MKQALLGLFACAVAMSTAACAKNEILKAPNPPEQLTKLTPENPADYKIRTLSTDVGDDQQSLYEEQRNASLDLACVKEDKWEMITPDDNTNITFRVASPVLDASESTSVQTLIKYFDSRFRALEKHYGRFQDFRRLYDANQHDTKLLAVAIQQGLGTMYTGRRLLDFAASFEAGNCSLKPFAKGLKAANAIVSDVGQGQLPAMMQLIDQRDHWTGLLLKIQLGIVTNGDALTPCGDAVKELKDGSTNYDTSILAWCGYAAAKVGQTEVAKAYWTKAGGSVHDPEGASYSLARLRDINEQASNFGKLKIQTLKSD
jgi:hypothetical protein